MERRPFIVIALEVVLGALAIMVGPVGALGMAAVALGIFKNTSIYFFSYSSLTVEDISDHELRLKVYSATGTTIAVCALEIIVKGALVFLQFLTITKNGVNSKTKILRLVDIVVSFLMAGGLIVCGVLLTVYGKESVWRDPINRVSADTTGIFIRQAMTTAGVFCFMGTALFILVAVLMLVFLVKDWKRREIRTNSASRQGNTAERETTGNEQGTNQTQI
ncbi:hypothetical protein GBAR_LOCUS20739 [Geodia barretti]|uniref:Uncharacterized protein n=1 Tax=Geodia barretti TaxID=519541 RepID=A0AA35SVW3_GEOBA|nr:hypothetical protein GBAR_LOCUS20739 [Geodia barretti]